jgi:flavin reductase (DIM6/NTAB) family NADH-FMN oxidoreductase RutF
VTIHSGHPFLEPDPERDPARRLRGRLGGAVTLWTSGSDAQRAGLTVSSVLVAAGEPARVLGLVDPDSDLALAVEESGTAVVALLSWRHRDLADAFAGVSPAPGGVFRLGTWTPTRWGPLLDGVPAWAGVRMEPIPRPVGWSVLLEGVIEHVDIRAPAHGEDGEDREDDADEAPLVHRRGRYVRPPGRAR